MSTTEAAAARVRNARYLAVVDALEAIAGDEHETPARRRVARAALEADRRAYPLTRPLGEAAGEQRHSLSGGLTRHTQAVEEGWADL